MPVSGGEPDGGGRAGGVAGHSASAVFDGDAAEDGAFWTAAWAVPDDDAPVGERSNPAASAVLEVGASTGDDAPVGKGYDAAASAVLDVGASAGDATVGEGSNVAANAAMDVGAPAGASHGNRWMSGRGGASGLY